jgi:tetratricopeptide (TPR) repeat protein
MGYTSGCVSNWENIMRKYITKLMILTMFSAVLAAAPAIRQANAGGDPPASDPPPTQTKKKKGSTSYMEDPAFVQGYRIAYGTIYDGHDYGSAISQLKALNRDDVAAVANLIGYSYRKLGDYKLSQVWYERALKSDPDHVKTWQYYGLWQVEQGNREQAQYHLSRIASICGSSCEEYRSLAAALDQPSGTGLTY